MVEVVTKIDPISGRARHFEKGELDIPRAVRVLPKNDEVRKFIKHPNGVGFPKGGGSAEWPNDTFTHRRIKSGHVTVEVAEAAPTQQRAKAKLPPPRTEKTET